MYECPISFSQQWIKTNSETIDYTDTDNVYKGPTPIGDYCYITQVLWSFPIEFPTNNKWVSYTSGLGFNFNQPNQSYLTKSKIFTREYNRKKFVIEFRQESNYAVTVSYQRYIAVGY